MEGRKEKRKEGRKGGREGGKEKERKKTDLEIHVFLPLSSQGELSDSNEIMPEMFFMEIV